MNLVILFPFFLIALILAIKYPVYGFIFGLTLFFNIGGYLNLYAFGLPGFFTILDVGLVFAFVAGIANEAVEKQIFFDNGFKKFLLICLAFSFYQILITIWIKLGISDPIVFIKELIYHKWRIFGIFFAIPTYFIIQKYPKEIYKIILSVTFIIMIIYLISLFTPLKLIKVGQIERGLEASVFRVGFRNYGYMMMVIPMGLFVYLTKVRIKYKNILTIGALGMLMSVILTLSRITIFSMAGSILITLILVKKYFELSLSQTLFKVFIFLMSSIIIILLLFPGVLSSLYNVYNITLQEFLGILPEGTTQSRTLFELVRMMPLFLNNLWFGTGYLQDFFSSYHTRWELGLADIPVLGNLAIYGVLGFLLYLLRYFSIFKSIKRIFNRHKKISLFRHLSVFEIALLMSAVIYFFTLVFFRLFYFSKDLVYSWNTIEFGFFSGILFGLSEKYKSLAREKT